MIVAFVVVLAAVSAAPALAASTPGSAAAAPRLLWTQLSNGLNETSVGEWASYEMDAGPGRRSFWRLAAVGEDQDARARPALWIEIELGPHPELASPLAQIRMLVARQPGFSGDGVTRLFVGLGSDPVEEVPAHSLEALTRQIEEGTGRAGAAQSPALSNLAVRRGGERLLMTSAGTISAFPIDVVAGTSVLHRMWLSRSVPLLHLAKLELRGTGYVLQVSGFGTGAKPRIAVPGEGRSRFRPELLERPPANKG